MKKGGKKDNTFPRVFDELGPRPIVVKNTEHLKRICEEKELVSAHVENESLRSRSIRPREGYKRWRVERRTGKLIRIA